MSAKPKELVTVEKAPPPISSEGATILAMIDRVLANPDVPVEKIEQLFELHQKVQADQARKEFAAAFTAAQAEMEPIAKDASNPQTKSKYATHAALDKDMRPIYTKHKLGVSFNTGAGDGTPIPPNNIRVLLTLIHESGHERVYQADIPSDGKGPKGNDVMSKTHAAGSAMTHGKRYLLLLAFNIAVTDQDDDGNGAANPILSAVQLKALKALVQEVGADEEKFCAYMEIPNLSEMPAAMVQRATDSLNLKRKK